MEARQSIQRLRDDLDAIKSFNPFSGVLESLRALQIEAKQGITIRVAAVFDGVRGLGNVVGTAGTGFAGGEGGPGMRKGGFGGPPPFDGPPPGEAPAEPAAKK